MRRPDGAHGRGSPPCRLPDGRGGAWIDEQLQERVRRGAVLSSYPSGQLGSEKDTLELARLGAIAVTRVHSSVLNNAIPATRILSLPYVFDSTEHMRRAFDGSFGDEILAACARSGMLGLAIYDSGSRNFYNTRGPSMTPSGPAWPEVARAAVGHLHGERRRARREPNAARLRRRVLRAADASDRRCREQLAELFHSAGTSRSRAYWSESEHAYAPDMLLMSKRVADALPAEQREFLLHAARQSVSSCASVGTSTVRASREAVLAAGVSVNAIDAAAFRRAVQPMVDRHLADPEIERLYEKLRELRLGAAVARR